VAKVIVFGMADFASLAHFYLKHDTKHEVVAFSVNADYMPADKSFEGLPVVPFEEVEQSHPPSDYAFFAPMSPRKMNRVREGIYNNIKTKGYQMVSYVSSRATVWPEAPIGDNCFILEDNTLQPFTPIGNNVVLWSGNHIGHHGAVHDHVSFTSHVVLSGHCTVERFCFFGVNATIRDGLKIGEGSLIAMAAAVIGDTEPWGVYKGSPAKKGSVPSNELDF
jgi:sugar O-acyltransferase (sialic acid O-acetyltransferase NeuD family)